MQTTHDIAQPGMLRNVLAADIAITAVTALLMAVAAHVLQAWTGLPEPLLRGVGIALLAYVAWVAWLRSRPSRRGAWTMIAINTLYAAECLLALAMLKPTGFGTAFVLLQAVFVVAIAWLVWRAMGPARRAAPAWQR